MACEGAQWARIYWKNADNNEVNFYSQHLPVFYELIQGGTKTRITYRWRQCFSYPDLIKIYDYSPEAIYTLQQDDFYQNCSAGSGSPTFFWSLLRNGVVISQFDFGGGRNAYDLLEIATISPAGSGCVLKISDNRGAIFQQTFTDTCPVVKVECSNDVCPPGTCEVLCHGHKCCYNAQGNVVKII
jgi:hypothetical protein